MVMINGTAMIPVSVENVQKKTRSRSGCKKIQVRSNDTGIIIGIIRIVIGIINTTK